MKKRYASAGAILKAALSLALLAIIFLKLDWAKGAALIRYSDPFWWGVALLITFGAVVVSAYKWRLILESQRVKVAVKKLLSSYFIGLFLNNFLPTSMGGDVFRAYDVARIIQQDAADVGVGGGEPEGLLGEREGLADGVVAVGNSRCPN